MDITFSERALQRLTLAQRDALLQIAANFKETNVEVHTAFDLPDDYIAVHLTVSNYYLGIDKDGRASS